MNQEERYQMAKELYAELGVDADEAIRRLKDIPVSLHCWQGDDVQGFENAGPLSGGIQATGNYPGKARTPEELMSDLDEAFKLIPGTHKLNLHASYAVFEPGEFADRDALEPRHFAKWVEFAKERGLGLDLTQLYFHIPRRLRRLCRAPTRKSGASGSITANAVFGFPSTLRKNWASPV